MPEEREEALADLHGNIWHQGTVYEATAYAVPFLVELVEAPTTESRVVLASLMGFIACGKGYHEVHNPIRFWKTWQERRWVSAARLAVQRELGRLCPMLSDPEVRAVVAFVLACFPEEAGRTAPALKAALTSCEDAEARAAIGLALAALGEIEPDAFKPRVGSTLPAQRIQALAEAFVRGTVLREDLLEILQDLGTSSFDERRLDDLPETSVASPTR